MCSTKGHVHPMECFRHSECSDSCFNVFVTSALVVAMTSIVDPRAHFDKRCAEFALSGRAIHQLHSWEAGLWSGSGWCHIGRR